MVTLDTGNQSGNFAPGVKKLEPLVPGYTPVPGLWTRSLNSHEFSGNLRLFVERVNAEIKVS